jgi:hypothetical protein
MVEQTTMKIENYIYIHLKQKLLMAVKLLLIGRESLKTLTGPEMVI